MGDILMQAPTFDDYLKAVQAQRDNAMNLAANLAAELAAARREIVSLQASQATPGDPSA